MSQVRYVVFRDDATGRAFQGSDRIAIVADGARRLSRGRLEHSSILRGVVCSVRTVVPRDLQSVAPTDRRPSIASDDRHTPKRLKERRRLTRLELYDLEHTGHTQCLVRIVRDHSPGAV